MIVRSRWAWPSPTEPRPDSIRTRPDVLINSRYDPARDEASPFEVQVGSHGGLGGPQARGFLLYPVVLFRMFRAG